MGAGVLGLLGAIYVSSVVGDLTLSGFFSTGCDGKLTGDGVGELLVFVCVFA